MTQRYVFWGGYAGNNLGDEAILWAMSRLIRGLDPMAKQSVFLPDGVSAAVAAQYDAWGIEVVSGSLVSCLLRLRDARLIVGGGQMVDDSSYGWPVGWSSLFLLVNRIFGHRPLVLCIGAEPLRRPLTRWLVRNFYSLAAAITCRDEESTASLQEVGLSSAKVTTTRDVVFSLDRALLPQHASLGAKPRSVALLIAYDPARIRDEISRYSHLVRALRARDFAVKLVAHDLRPDYDPRALREVMQDYAEDPGVTAEAITTVPEAFALYARVDAVVSGRMHPLIMATLAGTLPVAYGGKAKVRSLLRNAPIPSIAADVEPEQAVLQLEAALADKGRLVPELARAVEQFRESVEETTRRAVGAR